MDKKQIREAKVIELPETLTFPRVVEVFLENNWHKKMALCSTDEGVTCCAFNYDEHENLSEHRIIATWKIWREIKELSTLEQTIAEIDAEYQGRKFQIFHGKDWLQVGTERPDTNTSEMGLGKGGKTIIPENATPNQIVKIVYGLILAYVKHEASEGFKWKGKRVFNPHLKVDALYDIIIDENLE